MLFEKHRTNIFIVCFFMMLALYFMKPLASNLYFPGGDYLAHLGGLISSRLALLEGQFPIRLAPSQFNGWGYPYFQFYSPLPYTLGGLVNLLFDPRNPWVAYKIVILLTYVLAGVYAYRLARWLTGQRRLAILAGVAYMAAPYYLDNILTRGDYTEAVAQGILPVVLYYVLRNYFEPFNFRRSCYASLAWCALVTSHLITFAYFALFSGLLLIILTLKNVSNFKKFISFSLSAAFGFILAAWYLVPVIFQDNLYIRENLINPCTYSWTTTLAALFSLKAIPDHLSVGWTLLFPAFLSIYLLAKKKYQDKSILDQMVVPALSLFFIVLFMTWSPFDFWRYIPQELVIVQFSYRFLAQIAWLGLLVFLWTFSKLFPRLNTATMVFGALAIVFASHSWIHSPGRAAYSTHYLAKNPLQLADYTQTVYVTNQRKVEQSLLGNLELPVVDDGNHLFLNLPIILPYKLVSSGKDSKLHLSGEVVDHSVTLSAFLDGHEIAVRTLKPGNFIWDLSLKKNLNISANASKVDDFQVQFKALEEKPTILVKSISLTGLPPALTALPLAKMEQNCRHLGLKTVCEFDMPGNAKIVQFPALYFTNIQQVKLNGLAVPYLAVPYRWHVMAGLKLEPGHYRAEIDFNGIKWANVLSAMAWLALIFVLGAAVLREKYFKKI